jgi:uncharacterized membrane protein SirB2
MSSISIALMLHIGCVIASLLLLALRFARGLAGEVPNAGVLRWLPMAVDTLLIVAALTLCVLIQQFPFQQDWLTAKLVALFAYMGFGHASAGRDKSTRTRVILFSLAIAALIYAFSVALRADPVPW